MGSGSHNTPQGSQRPGIVLPSTFLSIHPKDVKLELVDDPNEIWSDELEGPTLEVQRDPAQTLKYTGGSQNIERAIASIVEQDTSASGRPQTGKLPLLDPASTAELTADELAAAQSNRSEIRTYPPVPQHLLDDQVSGHRSFLAIGISVVAGVVLMGGILTLALLAYPTLSSLTFSRLSELIPVDPTHDVTTQTTQSFIASVAPRPNGTAPVTALNAQPATPANVTTASLSSPSSAPNPSPVNEASSPAAEPEPAPTPVESEPALAPSDSATEPAPSALDLVPGELPDELVLPITFARGRVRPYSVDHAALIQLAQAMTAAPRARFEIIGFSSREEASSARRRRRIASRRAAHTMDLIRSLGPSRRRLESRGAGPDESLIITAVGQSEPTEAVLIRTIRPRNSH